MRQAHLRSPSFRVLPKTCFDVAVSPLNKVINFIMETTFIVSLINMTTKPIPLTDHDLRQMSDEQVSALTPAQKDELLVRTVFELRKSRDRLNQPQQQFKAAVVPGAMGIKRRR